MVFDVDLRYHRSSRDITCIRTMATQICGPKVGYLGSGGTRLMHDNIGVFIALVQGWTTMFQCVLWHQCHGVSNSTDQWYSGIIDESACKTVSPQPNEVGFAFHSGTLD